MKKGLDLQAKLAKSLDRANAKAGPRRSTKPAATPSLPAGGSSKLSISLYPTDTARIREIILYMTQNNCPLSASQAIRLALRSMPIDDNLIQIYNTMQQEDGRKGRATNSNP